MWISLMSLLTVIGLVLLVIVTALGVKAYLNGKSFQKAIADQANQTSDVNRDDV